ncbi:MAG: right-handed parallel beta-helix repeat-containing protein [Pseudomonadota bacterium]
MHSSLPAANPQGKAQGTFADSVQIQGFGPSGTISSPNSPCTLTSGASTCSVTVEYQKSNAAYGCVWPEGNQSYFSCSSSDSQQVRTWPHTNVQALKLELYAHNSLPSAGQKGTGQLLDYIYVQATAPQPPSGSISSSNSPCTLQAGQSQCSVNVQYNKANTPWACVWRAGSTEQVECTSSSSSQSFSWSTTTAGHDLELVAHSSQPPQTQAGRNSGTLLDTVNVFAVQNSGPACDVVVNPGAMHINDAVRSLGLNSSLTAANPGVVCLMPGVHLVTTYGNENIGVRLRSNLIVRGLGANASDTVVTITDNIDKSIFWGEKFKDTGDNEDPSVHNIRLENFKIDGNGDNQLPSYCRDGSDLTGNSAAMGVCHPATNAITFGGASNATIEGMEFVDVSGYCVVFIMTPGGTVRNSSFKDCGRKEYIFQDGHNGRQQKDALFWLNSTGGVFENNYSEYTDEYTNRAPYGNGGVGCYAGSDNLIIRNNTFINVSTGTIGANLCDNVTITNNLLKQIPSGTGNTGGEFAFDIVNDSSNITISNNTVENYSVRGVGVIASAKPHPHGRCVTNVTVTNNTFKVPFHSESFLQCVGGTNTRGFLVQDGHTLKASPSAPGDFYFSGNTIIPTDSGVDPSPHPDWCDWDFTYPCQH